MFYSEDEEENRNDMCGNRTKHPSMSTNNNAAHETEDTTNEEEAVNRAEEDNLDSSNSKDGNALYVGDDENLSMVLQSIREVISCCACFGFDFIMKECSNGHLLCQTCFLTLRQVENPQCPTCRAALYPDTRRALVAQKVLSELPDICPSCNLMMLHKDLNGHKLNDCPKRRVACGLAPLGCHWCGKADEYRQHYTECVVKKSLTERPLDENLDNVLSRFRKREQALRETFQCFSSVFRHFEGQELQSVNVVLSPFQTSIGKVVFKSDQFHSNQSRWTIELTVTFEEGIEESVADVPNEIEVTNEQVNPSHSPTERNNLPTTIETRPMSIHERNVGFSTRQRRNYRYNNTRHRPYPGWYHTRTTTGSSTSNMSNIIDLSTRRPTENDFDYNPSQRSPSQFGTLSFTMIKENSPGIGRKSYTFMLLQLESQENGIQVSIRPMASTHRFVSRGERTSNFTVCPMRWRYLTCLSELKECRLIHVELGIARRLQDDQAEQF